MLTVSNNIKNAYNQYTTQRKSKIKIGNDEYFIQNMDLYVDTYDEGNIVGNTIAKTLKFDIETEYVRDIDEFELYDGIWTGEEYEYINLGTFKLFEEQGVDDFFSSITAYDKLILFNSVFNYNLVEYPITIYGLLENICDQANVVLDTEEIANGSQILDYNLFVEGETLKDILKAICQISGTYAVISEDKLKLKLIGEDTIKLEDYQLSSPEYKRTTWKVNQVVLGMQDIEGEYVQKQDEEDVEENGVHKMVINNNPFTYTQALRQQYIDELFDQVKGFGYTAFEAELEGLPYVELGDMVELGKENYKINLGSIELCKINDYQDVIKKSTGKNLFDINEITVGYWVNGQGTYTSNANWNIGEEIEVEPNTNYTLSREETTGAIQIGWAEYDENHEFVIQHAQWDSNTNFKTWETASTTKYLRPMYNNTYAMSNIQFEKGSTPTGKEPFGKNKWYKYKKINKITFNGTENWAYPTSGSNYTFFQLSNDNFTNKFKAFADTDGIIYSDRFVNLKGTDNILTNNQGIAIQNTWFRISVSNDIATTVNNFKSWLSSNNVIAYYILNIPQIEEITNVSLINQLKEADVEILGETTQDGIPTPQNPIPVKNKTGKITVERARKSLILRYEIKSPNGLDSYLQAPSIIDSVIDYVDNTNDLENKMMKTEYKVDKAEGTITELTEVTTEIGNQLAQNYYTITQTDELVQNAYTGVTNTFSEAGGNNIFRNTGLWFETKTDEELLFPKSDLYPSENLFMEQKSTFEFWRGDVIRIKEEKAVNFNALLLQNGTLYQEQNVPNGNYTVSFKYKKLIELGNVKCIINDKEYVLESLDDTEFVEAIEVNSGHINVQFITDVNNACEIYDLMVNAGNVKLAYSQNQNETTTDTVNISKGITITSSEVETTFKANADGVRIYANNDLTNPKTKFTDKGTETDYLETKEEAKIVDILIQRVGNHTWMSKV